MPLDSFWSVTVLGERVRGTYKSVFHVSLESQFSLTVSFCSSEFMTGTFVAFPSIRREANDNSDDEFVPFCSNSVSRMFPFRGTISPLEYYANPHEVRSRAPRDLSSSLDISKE